MNRKVVKIIAFFLVISIIFAGNGSSYVLASETTGEEIVEESQNLVDEVKEDDEEDNADEVGGDHSKKEMSEDDLNNEFDADHIQFFSDDLEQETDDTERELEKENSWRYTNGELIVGNSIRAFGLDDYVPWSKVDDYFVNNLGEKIEGAVKKGIDVSHHNEEVDWEKVKETDVDFAIVRCGYGINTTSRDDRQWKRNADECTRLGIPFGTYLYSYAKSVEDAKSEAEHVLRLVEGYDLDYPIYYDLEDDTLKNLGNDQIAAIAKTFCDIIESKGYEVGIYANKYWWTTYLTDPVYDQWGKWVAQYNSQCTYNGRYEMWQATSSGTVDGLTGNGGRVDINFLFTGWNVTNIKTDVSFPQHINHEINLEASVVGEAENLQYKYVWSKNNWAEWGVLRDFSDEKTITWCPAEGGDYTIYLDVKDSEGNVKTINKAYHIIGWDHGGVETSLSSPRTTGTSISVNAKVDGDTSGLQYKFVWERDGWKEWGVLQEFSEKSTAEWTPKTTGKYTLHIDIKDKNGIMVTKYIDYEIVEKGWSIDSIKISPKSYQEIGLPVSLDTQLDVIVEEGNTFKYKYVWSKNNWAEWGIIQDFSDESAITWLPKSIGKYEVFVNVKDKQGNVQTTSVSYEITGQKFGFNGITASKQSPQIEGEEILLQADITGNSYGLQYKFVWMKDGWKSWGVLQGLSSSSKVKWTPDEAGTYYIYLDVKDATGKTQSKSMKYEIKENVWTYSGIKTSKQTPQLVNEEIEIAPVIQGGTTGFSYKFVWMKDNWKEWGVIQNLSDKSTATWKPEAIGNYTILVDVKDNKGKTTTRSISYEIKPWNYIGTVASKQSPQVKGTEIQLTTEIEGNTDQFQYKYVWMQDNWKKWGVIQQMSGENTAKWTPNESGEYWIYIDIRDATGKTTTKTMKYVIY